MAAHERWERERDRLEEEAGIASGNARTERKRFGKGQGARLAKATELASDEHRPEAALVRRAKAFDTVRRVHRELAALVEARARIDDPHEATRHERRINEHTTRLAAKAEYRMALDPLARRFARYEQTRSARAMETARSRTRDDRSYRSR